MGLRQRRWARNVRDNLFVLLGGYCIDCGAIKELEFDVIDPVGSDHHRKMEWSWRMSFYRKQHAMGNLALRCTHCNSRKGNYAEHPF